MLKDMNRSGIYEIKSQRVLIEKFSHDIEPFKISEIIISLEIFTLFLLFEKKDILIFEFH